LEAQYESEKEAAIYVRDKLSEIINGKLVILENIE